MNRDVKAYRSMQGELRSGDASEGQKTIEGYFAVFNNPTELYPGMTEELAPQAFDKTLDKDIRALVNHDTTLVLGRNKSNTLYLKTDDKGLYGRIVINENDTDAMNLYERVKRGDVSQCSFGFYIVDEESRQKEDGTWHFTIKETELFEVSVCTFPAYEDTQVQARAADVKNLEKRELDIWKREKKERLHNGIKSVDD